MKIKQKFYYFVIAVVVIFIYRGWFLSAEIIGGDWPYYSSDFLHEFSLIPHLWKSWQANGIGGIYPLLGLIMFSSSLIVPFVLWLNIPWVFVYKLGWFGLYLFLSIVSMRRLFKVALPQCSNLFILIGSLIYSTNTYILMLASGGQMGVVISYSIAPLILATFISFVNEIYKKNSSLTLILKTLVLSGLIFSIQFMIDPRIAYITAIAIFIYLGNSYFVNKIDLNRSIQLFTFVLLFIVIVLGINAYWLLPLLFVGGSGLDQFSSELSSADSVRYFSFATFENAISLLHPNWPENIFGKVGFHNPLYLFLPIIAFGHLFFTNTGKKRIYPIFFTILGLTGIFLAKGANDPFGVVYVWLFDHIPGFLMFRDPTKFYVLIVLSYSILIPLTLEIITNTIKSMFSNFHFFSLKNILPGIIFLVLWIFTINQAVLGELGGTFKNHTVPAEYVELSSMLKQHSGIYRTLWVPRSQRFTYSTSVHMSVEAGPLFNATNSAELSERLDNPATIDQLNNLGVRYVIVPYDSLGEIFLNDRKYDSGIRQEWEDTLDEIAWLTKVQDGPITVYETPSYREKIWLSTGENVSYTRLNQDKYIFSFSISKPSELNFSESYHSGWKAKIANETFISQKSEYGLNQFTLDEPGIYSGEIIFSPQKYVIWGMVISIGTVIGIIYLMIFLKRNR